MPSKCMTIFEVSNDQINLFGDVAKHQVRRIDYGIRNEVGEPTIINISFECLLSVENYKRISEQMLKDSIDYFMHEQEIIKERERKSDAYRYL